MSNFVAEVRMRNLDATSFLHAHADEITVSIRCTEDRPSARDDGWVTLVWRDGRWNTAARQPADMSPRADC